MNNKRLDITQLQKVSDDFTKKTNKENISILFLTLIFTIIGLLGLFLFIYFISKSQSSIMIPTIDPSLLILIAIPLPFLYSFIVSRKNNGRSMISIKINCDKNQLDNKMNELLKQLCYKEKKYRNSRAFYAYNNRYGDSASLSRYISYSFKDNILTIEAWAYIMGRELPIDNKRFGFHHKKSLVCDLEYIIDNVSNDDIYKN